MGKYALYKRATACERAMQCWSICMSYLRCLCIPLPKCIIPHAQRLIPLLLCIGNLWGTRQHNAQHTAPIPGISTSKVWITIA